jgi:hypothetical protein
MPHHFTFSNPAHQPPLISATLHHINWITNPRRCHQRVLRFNCFRSEVANKWRGCGVRSDTQSHHAATLIHYAKTRVLFVHFRLCTHTIIPVSHLFCCVFIIIWWFWIKRSQLSNSLRATMTYVALICFKKNFLIFKKKFFCLSSLYTGLTLHCWHNSLFLFLLRSCLKLECMSSDSRIIDDLGSIWRKLLKRIVFL